MEAARGVLTLLRLLAERPRSRSEISDLLREEGLERGERSVRRWLAVLRSSGFDLRNSKGLYELQGSPVRLAFDDYETLATLSVLGSLAAREPVYGTYLASAVRKLRAAIPEDSLRFADGGSIEFAFDPASDPPEDPAIMDTLRRATRQSRRAEISYHSLRSDTVRRRTVEPVRLAHAQRAHRLYAYEREENRVTEFRVNRIREATMLPEKFSPEAHRHSLEDVRVRLSEKAFTALGKTIIPDEDATIEPEPDGGAIVTGTTPSIFWTVRDLAALGPEAEILGSPKLKEAFLSFLRETSEKYS